MEAATREWPSSPGVFRLRPTKQISDLEYWSQARQYWSSVLEQYFLLDDGEGEARAQQRLFAAELAHQEATGEIVVYSGRKNPRWA